MYDTIMQLVSPCDLIDPLFEWSTKYYFMFDFCRTNKPSYVEDTRSRYHSCFSKFEGWRISIRSIIIKVLHIHSTEIRLLRYTGLENTLFSTRGGEEQFYPRLGIFHNILRKISSWYKGWVHLNIHIRSTEIWRKYNISRFVLTSWIFLF